MPRANRYLLPGQIPHITHRCHNREFLLRFDRDRCVYRWWLWILALLQLATDVPRKVQNGAHRNQFLIVVENKIDPVGDHLPKMRALASGQDEPSRGFCRYSW